MKVPWRVVLIAVTVSVIVELILRKKFGIAPRDARLLIYPFLLLIIVWYASRGWTKNEMLARWARTRGLEANASTAPDVERYLQHQRRFTALGGVLGLAVAWGYDRLTTPSSFDWVVALFLVVPLYAVLLSANMLGERTFTPEAKGDVRKAQLISRRLSDYIPLRIVVLLRLLGATTTLVALGGLFFEVSGNDAALLLMIGLTTAVFVLVIELSQRWRTQWPLPFDSTDTAHLQDVLRADAIRLAIWGGVVASSAALAAQLVVLGRQIDHAAGWALPFLGALLMAFSAVSAYRSSLRGFTLARRGSPVRGG